MGKHFFVRIFFSHNFFIFSSFFCEAKLLGHTFTLCRKLITSLTKKLFNEKLIFDVIKFWRKNAPRHFWSNFSMGNLDQFEKKSAYVLFSNYHCTFIPKAEKLPIKKLIMYSKTCFLWGSFFFEGTHPCQQNYYNRRP